jgi:hypothetical protein
LDELNARAQAIRYQHGQLSQKHIPVPGRPYGLHEGDEVQIRHTINHPDHGPLRNGTGATITVVDTEHREVELRLADGTRLRLDLEQVEQADVRLAYVQHPFPAQGHTTDTTHVIITTQATREGTYVALTRARERTDIYHATDIDQTTPAVDPLKRLAERVSESEPEVPSINTPLAHETNVTANIELEADREGIVPVRHNEIEHQHEPVPAGPRQQSRDVRQPAGPEPNDDPAVLDHDPQEHGSERARVTPDTDGRPHEPEINTEHSHEHKDAGRRVWPGRTVVEPDRLERDAEVLARDRTPGHEL